MRDLWTRRIAFLLIGGLIGVNTPEPARLVVLGIFLLFGVRIWLWRPRDFFGPSFHPEILVLTVGILVGILYGFTGSKSLEPPLVLNQVEVVGELTEWTVNDDGATGNFNFRERKYRLKVYPNSEGDLLEGWQMIQPGDTLRFTAKLEHPKPPGTRGQFDLPLYYAVRGLSGSLTAQGDAEIVSPGEPSWSWVVRNHVRELLEGIPSSQTGVLEGILFGDTSRIPEADLERYRITGVYHVFSASGSNVAFLLVLCWGVLKFLPTPLRAGVSILVLIFYAVLCGGNPPILRATVMGIFVVLGRLGSGRRNSLRGLIIAALFLFIWRPLNLKDTGFQLSFMATWGIIVLSPRFAGIRRIRCLPQMLQSALVMTCAAQLATLPLLIQAFHRLSLIGFAANLAVLFIIGSIFEIGIIGVLLSFLPGVALPVFQVSLWLLSATSEALFQLARIPWADAWVINPGALFWVCWYGGILVFLVGKERVLFTLWVWASNFRRWIDPVVVRLRGAFREILPKEIRLCLRSAKLNALSLVRWGKKVGIRGERAFLVVFVLLLLWSPWNTPRVLEVTFIDVGQGDSILIETPKGTRILVDTGPKSERFDAGERILVPYLLQNGIKHLDALILTHAHADHVGGAAAVLKTIPVDWVGVPEDGRDWLNGEKVEDERDSTGSGWGEESGLDRDLVNQLTHKKIEKMTAGDRLTLDSDIQLSVLAPGELLTGTHSDENNNSLVLRLENQAGQSVLLTADMEEEEMEEILRTGQDFSTGLFKVPHHGSRFSLDIDWLDQIDPQAVVIPVGKNTFGHPNSGVLQYWEDRRVPIYRTDEDGTIRVRIDKERMEIIPGRDTFHP